MKIQTTREITYNMLVKFEPCNEQWLKFNDLTFWLQETFGNADNINLVLSELGRLKDEV